MIALGSDHAAFAFKEELKAYLTTRGCAIRLWHPSTEPVGYCDYGYRVGEAVASAGLREFADEASER